MNLHGRRGRPSKPYCTSWGESIDGLRRERDGRWRIVETRDTFTEVDETQAVRRFRAWQDRRAGNTIQMPHEGFESIHDFDRALADPSTVMTVTVGESAHPTVALAVNTPAAPFWSTMRRLLIENPRLCADMTGLPSLLTWHTYAAPKPAIRLQRLLDVYTEHSTSKPQSKAEAANQFRTFMTITGADTLDDLTTDRLTIYRTRIKADCDSPGTVAAYFGRVKNIIRFGKSEGEDAAQIDAALSRMAILKAPPDKRVHNPTPVSREHFHALLVAADAWPEWKPRLLVMLNLCLHFDEALDVEWTDFKLDAATFVTKRNKRGRVIRAATLWPETVAALTAIPRTGSPFVFVSNRGTRFNAKGAWKTWDKLRTAAKCPAVQMDDIRDGAYTAACNAPGVEEKVARLLAGHRSHGLQDNYVQRNPAIVRPASDAVYAAYFSSL